MSFPGCEEVRRIGAPGGDPTAAGRGKSSILSGYGLLDPVGGNVAFVSLPPSVQPAALQEKLRTLSLPGVTLRGTAPLWWGTRTTSAIDSAVKQALDPQNRFPEIDH